MPREQSVRFSCDQPVIDQRRSNSNRVMYYLIELMLVDAELADRDGSALLRRRTGSLGWREHRPRTARRRIHSAILSQPEPEVVRATPPAPRHASSAIPRPGATSAVSSRENWKTGREIERERERERTQGRCSTPALTFCGHQTVTHRRIFSEFNVDHAHPRLRSEWPTLIRSKQCIRKNTHFCLLIILLVRLTN